MAKKSKYNIFGTEQGIYKPSALNQKGELKYAGKLPPTYRSSYEKQCFYLLEKHPEINWWKSEATIIKYISPLDGNYHNYFIDLTFEADDANTGKPITFFVEVKPSAQTKRPIRTPKKRSKTFITECKTYAVNVAKWNAAKSWADKVNGKFFIWTETGMIPWEIIDLKAAGI